MAKSDKTVDEPKEDLNGPIKDEGISRRSLLKWTSALTAAAMFPTFLKPSLAGAEEMAGSGSFVYVGNVSIHPAEWGVPPTSGRGFSIFKYNKATGDLELIKAQVMDTISAGQTCLDSKRNILYSTHEMMTSPGSGYPRGGGGMIYALAINPKTGDLTEINHKPSYGSLPSYPAVDPTGKYLLVTHHTGNAPTTRTVKDASGKYNIVVEYDEAAVVLFRLNPDGSIGDPCDIYKLSGSGPGVEQTHPRVHSVMMSPSGNLFAVCDKGGDMLYFFRINRQTEKLELCGGQGYKSIPGSSPRYSAFHPTRHYFYMDHETKPVISAFRYDEAGKLELIQVADALPEGIKIKGSGESDIRVHPSGKYLYDLLREVDLITVFAIDDATGKLERIQTVKLDGSGPRGCAISPDGRFLIIALTDSHKIVEWAIGPDGKVSPTGKGFNQTLPGNVTFFPA